MLGATYKNMERYYTKNGLLLTEDLTFNESTKHQIVKTPVALAAATSAADTAAFEEIRGILQPNHDVINLYLNRELRFYANLGITGGYWRSYTQRIATNFFRSGPGGRGSSGNIVNVLNSFWTAIGAQKVVHINSKAGNSAVPTPYPLPIIRLSDLYLMKAEALNEVSGPSQEVWDAINIVRTRAGIPKVEDAYTSTVVTSAARDNHTRKVGCQTDYNRMKFLRSVFIP